MRRVISGILSWFKYLLAVYMMLAGIATALFVPIEPDSNLGFIYESKTALVLFGIWFFLSGLALFLGKVTRKHRLSGYGLFSIYMCFLFAFFLNWIGLGWDDAWGNLIGAVVVGLLYLRWKYYIYYYTKPLEKRPGLGLDSSHSGV